MQVLITHGTVARTRVLDIARWQFAIGAVLLAAFLMLVSGAIYHFVFLKAAREGWPGAGPLMKLIVRDEMESRERFMRDNLDAIAQRVGEMQAKLVKLEAMGERVFGLAGVKADELKPLKRDGPDPKDNRDAKDHKAARDAGTAKPDARGGPYLPLARPSLEQLQHAVDGLDLAADQNTDIFTLIESRLLQSRLASLMVPSSAPVAVQVGSGFGFRSDPFTGRHALHTGLDFPADSGTPIQAAAGGIVISSGRHAAYGNMLEIDHGNGLVTRYAHCSSIEVQPGAVVRRGQRVARIGNTGRSTGPHLHFEVLVDEVPQDPARFLAGSNGIKPAREFARRPTPKRAPAAAEAPAAVAAAPAETPDPR